MQSRHRNWQIDNNYLHVSCSTSFCPDIVTFDLYRFCTYQDKYAIYYCINSIVQCWYIMWLKQFTCATYDSMTQHSKVNDLRQELFPTRVKLIKRLPPTRNALLQRVNRCVYQASIWTESLKPVIAAPSPDGFGWYKSDSGWHPIWTTVPAASVACRELIKCGCKAVPMCGKNCKCKKAGMACTALCQCRGDCEVR